MVASWWRHSGVVVASWWHRGGVMVALVYAPKPKNLNKRFTKFSKKGLLCKFVIEARLLTGKLFNRQTFQRTTFHR